MEALISGRAGVALVIEGGQLASIHVDEPGLKVPRHARELHLLAGEGRDFVALENASRESIVHELSRARDREDALQLALILMDHELADDLRSEASTELDELLASENLAADVESVLYAKPLPPEADLEGGLALAGETQARRAAALLQRLSANQAAIAEVCAAWDAIPRNAFGDEEQRWRSTVVREGLFRQLALHLPSRRQIKQIVHKQTKKFTLHSLPKCRDVLRAWTDSVFRSHNSTHNEHLEHQPTLVCEPQETSKLGRTQADKLEKRLKNAKPRERGPGTGLNNQGPSGPLGAVAQALKAAWAQAAQVLERDWARSVGRQQATLPDDAAKSYYDVGFHCGELNISPHPAITGLGERLRGLATAEANHLRSELTKLRTRVALILGDRVPDLLARKQEVRQRDGSVALFATKHRQELQDELDEIHRCLEQEMGFLVENAQKGALILHILGAGNDEVRQAIRGVYGAVVEHGNGTMETLREFAQTALEGLDPAAVERLHLEASRLLGEPRLMDQGRLRLVYKLAILDATLGAQETETLAILCETLSEFVAHSIRQGEAAGKESGLELFDLPKEDHKEHLIWLDDLRKYRHHTALSSDTEPEEPTDA